MENFFYFSLCEYLWMSLEHRL